MRYVFRAKTSNQRCASIQRYAVSLQKSTQRVSSSVTIKTVSVGRTDLLGDLGSPHRVDTTDLEQRRRVRTGNAASNFLLNKSPQRTGENAALQRITTAGWLLYKRSIKQENKHKKIVLRFRNYEMD